MLKAGIQKLISPVGVRALGLGVAAVAAFVLLGHASPDWDLEYVLPGLSPIPANTALALVFAGLAVACLVGPPSTARRLGYVLALAVAVLATVSLLEQLKPTGQDLDLLLFPGLPKAAVRVSELAALALACLSGGLLLLYARRSWPGELLALCATFSCLLILTWEAFRPVLPTPPAPQPYLVITWVLLFLLCAATLLARRDRGWIKLVASTTPGGQLARRLLPVAILSPPVLFLCFAALGANGVIKGVYVGVLAFVSVMLVFAAVVVWYALVLDRLDARRGQAEGELRRSEKRFRALFENSHDIIALVSPDGTMLYVSPSVTGTLGYTPEHLTGKDFHTLIDEPDVAMVRRDLAATSGPGTLSREYRVRHHDGSWRWLHATRTNLLDDPSITAHVLNLRDITERQKADEALRISEERYRDLVENANDVIYTHDLQGTITAWNRAAERLMGYTAEEITGINIARIVVPEHLELARAMTARKLAGGGRTVYELDVLTKNGHRLTIEISSRLANLPGQPTQVQGVARDVTERKTVERTLKEADRKKDDFLALLAHELRNPLAPLRNGLQVMKLAADDSHAVAAARAMMDRQLGHMVRLIDDLLDVSRISRNKLELQKAPVHLEDVIASAVETARPAIDDAGHALTVDLPTEPLLLDADLTRLGQVFSNLLTNAAKYTPPGGHIRLRAHVEEGHIQVAVSDNGIGIPAAALPHIFDMFSQVDRSIERKAGGLGIGLALVKGLVEMHGGEVSANSDGPDRGSTFTIRLPILRATAEPLAQPIKEHGHSLLSTPQRVLIVDDNRDAAASMALMLTKLGNEVRTAHDGQEAIDAAEQYRPDVILMDIGMPRLNGLDATKEIRTRPWGHATTIVALTGWGQDADRARSHAAGCDAHLVKPVSITELDQVLHDLRPTRNGQQRPARPTVDASGVSRL